ncbi:hypothetical protein PIB30_011327 [Stylosanthes scabra]|uniref:Uncharacterized protein n=1 Tax=Stylosanthes scabra TaxID=79078 RepID=A0ABU6W5W4_9FABA|nr:hypothetical protein [Stylosanthes scabra]
MASRYVHQDLLSGHHCFSFFHRLSCDRSFPSLSIEELSQGGFHLLHSLVVRWVDYLFRGNLNPTVIVAFAICGQKSNSSLFVVLG